MADLTTNFGLHKPVEDDNIRTYLTTDLATDMQVIDTAMGLHSMARQAIIDGNFQIAQAVPIPGTEVTNPSSGAYPIFDLWSLQNYPSGATFPTVKHKQRLLTPGELDKSDYCYSINVNGTGSSFGDYSAYYLIRYIEHGTRYLCGNGKKITLSFKARSNINGKKLGFYLDQYYGSGGSPSAYESLTGSNVTLTTAWQTFTFTFTTNTLSGKTFGTNRDDTLRLYFWLAWGNGWSTFGSSTTETFVGAGDIEIAQVQLCSGDVALPFEPKSFADELRACQRYYYREVGTSAGWILDFFSTATGVYNISWTLPLPVCMRISGTATIIGTWTANNCTQPGVSMGTSKQNARFHTQASSAGAFECIASNGAGFEVDARF